MQLCQGCLKLAGSENQSQEPQSFFPPNGFVWKWDTPNSNGLSWSIMVYHHFAIFYHFQTHPNAHGHQAMAQNDLQVPGASGRDLETAFGSVGRVVSLEPSGCSAKVTWSMHSIDTLSLYRFDILAIRTLTHIHVHEFSLELPLGRLWHLTQGSCWKHATFQFRTFSAYLLTMSSWGATVGGDTATITFRECSPYWLFIPQDEDLNSSAVSSFFAMIYDERVDILD